MTDRILLLSAEPLDQQFAESLSRSTKIPLLRSESEVNEEPGKQDKVSVFCNAESDRKPVAARFDFHLMSLPVHSKQPGNFAMNQDVSGVIFRGLEGSQECADVYSRVLRPAGNERAGLKEILSPGAEILELKLTAADQRQSTLERAESLLKEKGCPRRILPFIVNAADELLMNAIFDAPVDANGKARHRQTPRDRNFALAEQDQVMFSVGMDSEYLGVSASDQFGSLNPEGALRHIMSRIKPLEYVVDPSTLGAGLGLGMILRSGGSLIFSVERGIRTEVTAIYRKRASYAKFRNQFQFVVAQSPENSDTS